MTREIINKDFNERLKNSCMHCGYRVVITWNPKIEKYEMFCPRCGKIWVMV